MSYFVYIHTCPNGKKYVGLTTTTLNHRWLGGAGYSSQYFSRAIKKYGWDSIEHEVYEVDTKEEMSYLERYLIAYYNTTNPNNGYNIHPGGERMDGVNNPMYGRRGKDSPSYGLKRSNETKLKQSHAKPCYPVLMCDADGNIISEYYCVREAARQIGKASQNIDTCCKRNLNMDGKLYMSYGFVWKYKYSNKLNN